MPDKSSHYEVVARAIHFLKDKQFEQPSLEELSEHVGLSPYYLQKVFTEWAGVSPKQFLQYLTKEKAKSYLRHQPVMDSAYASGLSGASRLHDLMLRHESMTPGEYKSQGKDLDIAYTSQPCPFGLCFLAWTKKGVCKLAFHDQRDEQEHFLAELRTDWPMANLCEDPEEGENYIQKIFPDATASVPEIKILMQGTPFQLKVWEALLKVTSGEVLSYQQIAEKIGEPDATRAVASAIAKNNIGYLIPCHRIIRSSGEFNQYRWGTDRKAALIGYEQAALSKHRDAVA